MISASYAKFAGDRNSGFAGFTAFSAKGKVVNSFTSEELKSYDLSGSALTAETAKDGIVKITESHIIAIFPVTSGKKNKFVGTVATAWTLEQINADAQAAAIRSLIIAVIVLLSVVGLLTTFIRRILSKPINNITDSMDHLAQGDLDTDVPFQSRRDEIGRISASLQVFKEKLRGNKRLEAQSREAEQHAAAAAAEEL